MKAKTFHRLIGWILAAGWLIFVLLLAGVASGLLMRPIAYHP